MTCLKCLLEEKIVSWPAFFLISKNGHFYLFILVRSNRALINVWIPSVFLRGKAANAFHVYQVSTWVSCQPVVFVPWCFACWHYLYICRICADEVVCGHWSGGRMCMEFPVVALCCCCSVTVPAGCFPQHHTPTLFIWLQPGPGSCLIVHLGSQACGWILGLGVRLWFSWLAQFGPVPGLAVLLLNHVSESGETLIKIRLCFCCFETGSWYIA